MKGYPRKFLYVLVVTFAVLFVSGLFLIPTVLDLRLGFDVVWRLSGEQRLWVAGTHTALAFLLCCLAGAVWSIHMRVGWRSGRHILSGLIAVGLLGGAALSALGLYYFGEESWLLSASVAHTLVGIFGVACAGLHWSSVLIERSRRSAVNRVEADDNIHTEPKLRLVPSPEERQSAQHR